jgi:hypothetical protein
VIGFLRFVGLTNAAIWLGASVYYLLGAAPAARSLELQELIGLKNFAYFSIMIGQIFARPFFHLYFACSVVAVVHLMAEWLYLGKYPRRGWLALVLAVAILGTLEGYWLQPRFAQWHRLQYTSPERREAAGRAFRAWQTTARVINCFLVAGLAVYLWRVGNPPDPARFVSTSKFRS